MVTAHGRRSIHEPVGFLARAGARGADRGQLPGTGDESIGPTIADGAVVYDEIASQAELPAGWRANQAPGNYRLEHARWDRLFDYVIGPTAWKRFTFPPRVPVTVGRRDGGPSRSRPSNGRRSPRVPGRARLRAGGPRDPGPHPEGRSGGRFRLRRAAVGCVHRGRRVRDRRDRPASAPRWAPVPRSARVRPCPDRARRRVHRAGRVAGRGRARDPPAARRGRGRAPGRGHGRRRGDAPLDRRSGRHRRPAGPPASPTSTTRTGRRSPNAASRAPTAPSSARPASARASASGPTSTDRSRSPSGPGTAASPPASPGSPGELPAAGQDRYRQWLTHKFATWWDQFGCSGCVGCGRCVTWCPVGIDVRAELYAIAGSRSGARAAAVAIPPVPTPTPVGPPVTAVAIPDPPAVAAVPSVPAVSTGPVRACIARVASTRPRHPTPRRSS